MCTLDAYHRKLATSVWLTPSRVGSSARPQLEFYSNIRLHTVPGPRVLHIWPEEVGSVTISWPRAWPVNGTFRLRLVDTGGRMLVTRAYQVAEGADRFIVPEADRAMFTMHWRDLAPTLTVSCPRACTLEYVPSCKLMDTAYITSDFVRLIAKIFSQQEKRALLTWAEARLRDDAVDLGMAVNEPRLKHRLEHFMRHATVITMDMLQRLRKDRSLLQKPDLDDNVQIFLSKVPFKDSGLCAV